ncbi:MAG: class I SAM-dependent methyltransferase [Chloroflexota bacterium]
MSVKKTIATYDQIAKDYSHRWHDRSVIAPALDRFSALLAPGATILDAGCGPGFDCSLLRERQLRAIGIDLSGGMLQIARDRYPGPYVQADMRRLPLCSGVAGIWCNAALLHLSRPDARQVLREFRRVLAPGGVLFLAVKEGRGEMQRSETYGSDAPRYFTYWRADRLDLALRESDFRILESWVDAGARQRWLCRLARKPSRDNDLLT